MHKYIEIKNKKMEMILKAILVLSCPFLTLLLSNRYENIPILVGMILSLFIFAFFAFKKLKLKKINTLKLISSVFISSYMIKCFFDYIDTNKQFIISAFHFFHIYIRDEFMIRLVGVAAVFSLIYFVYIFIDKIIPKVIKFFKSFTKTEKSYFLIVLILGIVFSFAICHYTSAFGLPVNKHGASFPYDTIYVSDSGFIIAHDAYFNVSNSMNDVRQPLFGIFSLPFSVPAKILSEFCFFLAKGTEYSTIMMVIQCVLISITLIMIGRMFNLEEKYKKYLYMLFHASFSYILWAFVLEQYAIATFYLILALYIYSQNKEKINYAYVGAVGTLLTSGIIFPVITKFKNVKQWIKDVFKCFVAFISILVIGGQTPQLINGYDFFMLLINGHGGLQLSFVNKLQQFFEFIKGMFIATSGRVVVASNGFASYHLKPISSFWYLGIVILILCVLGYILNRKEKFAKVCMLWIIFSFLVAVIVGWGAKEKCLVLYGLYFSWAYLGLIFMLLKKIIKKYSLFKLVVILLSIFILVFSLQEFINILQFAVKYYRVY